MHCPSWKYESYWGNYYYNSLLQCLLHINLLPHGRHKQNTLSEALSQLRQELDQDKAVVGSPALVKSAVGRIKPQFGTNQQQDAAELFLVISKMLHKELGEKSELATAVKGYVTSKTICKVCLEEVTERQPFHQLQLAVPTDKRACTLQDCYESEFRDTILVDASCGYCGEIGSRTRSQSIELPNVLIVTLKRFGYNGHTGTKNSAYIAAPLHVWSPVDGGPTYSLAATLNHKGPLMECGHYVANCLREKWYLVDITRTQPILQSSVISQDDYILFYVSPPVHAGAIG